MCLCDPLRPLGAMLLCLGLVACGTPKPPVATAPEVSPEVRFTDAGRAMALRAAVPFRVETLRGGQVSPEASVAGADCDLVTPLWTARVTTPARLDLPSFGPEGPALQITCRKDGLQASASYRLRNLTELVYANRAIGQVAIGFGVIGAAVVAGQAGSRDAASDVWGYEPASIPLR